ncbi:WecB/TagA/CpsF family glycosyltransferase [Bacillus rubiinfantis]|uniref:WecB/TagA/CpsF family glycosyltransferase n=1 Tax=Bacillus rubiinfantis TaxID=1499680 RepID=UPI0005A8B048|nr:WecB/TagA/CpsF family glycosyltransferase [Bacillus rubiinfantis]
MKAKTVNILGIDFINLRFDDVVEIAARNIEEQKKSFIVTANPEIVMYACEHTEYRQIVQTAAMVVPDGIGIVIASKLINHPLEERVAGYDLMVRLLELGDQKKWRIYLLGGKDYTNKKAVYNISKRYPNVQIVGSHHGFFDWNETTVADEIKAVQPDIVFVALGFPKQEQWIARNIDSFTKGLFMGVGGSIDVLAGEVKRAPLFWRKLNLEWLYRLLKQPSRWRRILALPRFLIKIFQIKLSK